jgi:glycerol-3-phosphate O-acyltransferase/dihydroxyacetone phosphate acyltransferase
MGSFPISGFTALDSKEGFDEAAKKIREAMKERGAMRRRKSQQKNGFINGVSTDEEYESEESKDR